MTEFTGFGKIARWSREVVITEKIDGTNGCIFIGDDDEFRVGSRTRWITLEDDNYGFARWAYEHKEELLKLGPGRHFGEWWGQGIQRKYGLAEKRFSLFNTSRWCAERPACCHVVPLLHQGILNSDTVSLAINRLSENGSLAAPGFMTAEGIIIYHIAAGVYFKKTIHSDAEWKGQNET